MTQVARPPSLTLRLVLACGLAGLSLLPPAACAATASPGALPQRNLVIEWRQIDEAVATSASQTSGPNPQATVGSTQPGPMAATGGYSVSTQQQAQQAPNQQLRVLNGSRAQMVVNQSVPVMWVEAVQSGLGALPAGSGGAINPRHAQPAVGFAQNLTWLQAGRQISLLPRWPGRDQPAVVEVQVDSASLGTDRPPVAGAAPLPVQSSTQTVTTVLAPLGQWVTIARSGAEPAVEQRGVVSTQTLTAQPRQVMQIRVMVP